MGEWVSDTIRVFNSINAACADKGGSTTPTQAAGGRKETGQSYKGFRVRMSGYDGALEDIQVHRAVFGKA